MENEKLFEFMTQMYSDMKEGFKNVGERLDKVDTKLEDVETDVKSLNKTTLSIEQDHGKKLEVLFDGYKQNAEQLNRIEEEVKKHDEVILRRIK